MFLETKKRIVKNIRHKNPVKKEIPVKISLLGGLGEIGKNMMVLEYMKDMIIIDCGIMFPDEEFFGIDLILPDYNYVKSQKKQLKAILITHGHEDHIGGIPFIYKELGLDVPIYAPKFAMELIKKKFEEFHIKYDPKKLHIVKPRQIRKVSSHFKAEFISVNHSISDSFAIALHTNVGTIVHTGDFKIDFNPVDESSFDIHKFAELGEKGVTFLMSDSTNVEHKYSDKSEKDVSKSLDAIISNAKGRVIVATFASNISRVSELVNIGIKNGRKVAVLGRNMESNFEIARSFGYIKISDSSIVKGSDINKTSNDKLLIIMTGSQGEPMAALSLISRGMHKLIKVKPNDCVILSSSVIPGNEKSVSKIVNSLFTLGAKVHHERTEGIHVSGHATREQLQLMLRLLKPKFFMPIHGEPRHLMKHCALAEEMGWRKKNIVSARNGDVIDLCKNKVAIVDKITMDSIFVDGSMIGDVKKLIRERKTMSEDGVIMAIAGIRKMGDAIECIPDVICRGFFYGDELKGIIDDLKEVVNKSVLEKFHASGFDYNALNSSMKKSVEKHIHRNFRKNPMVVTRIIEVDL